MIDTEQIRKILIDSDRPLPSRAIATRIRFLGDKDPDYLVIRKLRQLLMAGEVERTGGMWRITRSDSDDLYRAEPDDIRVRLRLPISRMSAEILGLTAKESELSHPIWIDPEQETEIPEREPGGWARFRSVCAYYRRCIQNERGSEAIAYNNTLGERFLFLRTAGKWRPQPGVPWHMAIPIGNHMARFLNSLPSGDDQSLVLGYPVQAVYLKKENEPDIAFVQPVFVYRLKHQIKTGALELECQSPRPEINLKWLEHAFHKPETQSNFMVACGFLNQRASWDDTPGPEPGEAIPHLVNFVKALESFMPDRLEESLHMEAVPDFPIQEPFNTGIYNRAVVMGANKVPYHVNLLRELAAIEQAPEEELNRTALRYLFLEKSGDAGSAQERKLERIEIADYIQLNAEQRHAISALLSDPVTVVTGPPGTGKSQVVTSTVLNARLRNKSVLFSSHNHKAIDAVMERFDTDEDASLIIRANSKEYPNLKVTFRDAIKIHLQDAYEPAALERFSPLWEECEGLLRLRGEKTLLAEEVARASEELGVLEEKMSDLSGSLNAETIGCLENRPEVIPQECMDWLVKRVYELNIESKGEKWYQRIIPNAGLFKFFFRYRRLRRALSDVPGLPVLPSWPFRTRVKAVLPELPILERASEYARLRTAAIPWEEKAKALPEYEELSFEIVEDTRRIKVLVGQLTPLDVERRRGLPPEVSREELQGLMGTIQDVQTGLADGAINRQAVKQVQQYAPIILRGSPCWAVTTLSVGSRLPLAPGLFDVAIIDEASQTDIPSAIPILFRARRAGVVGDPFQLKHTTNLSPAKDTVLRSQAGIARMKDYRFSYSENSLYGLFSAQDDAAPIMLTETFRSADEIAEYSNMAFYQGRLRVATDTSRLNAPSGMKLGIHWTEVQGEVESGGEKSCHCPEEADKVISLTADLLEDGDFKGTIGIVTPFRPQANRIQDALFSGNIPYARVAETKLHVDTAHGFQGDERDVIFFSLCAGPDMPAGSIGFLRKEAHLFNVAVSRARAIVHMVGNRSWAKHCGIHHIELLAREYGRLKKRMSKGPWYPHESPYEKMLFEALVAAKLSPLPQHPVSSRRLDMALIGQGDPDIKIDIEVDGDCHRNPDGTRKGDDIWRDIQLQALGWKVMRFWTYELREDMDQCVRKIKDAWRKA